MSAEDLFSPVVPGTGYDATVQEEQRRRWRDQGLYDLEDRIGREEEYFRALQDQYGQGIVDSQGRRGIQTDYSQAQQDYLASLQVRRQQQALMGRLEEAMDGKGPSVAEKQLYAGRDAAIKQQMAMAASARGGGAARSAAARQAADLGADATMTANQQAGQLRAQEQLAARQQAIDLANQIRQGDFTARGGSQSQAQFQAGMDMQQRELNDRMSAAYLQAQQNASQSLLNSGNQQWSAHLGYQANTQDTEAKRDIADAQNAGLLGGAGIGAAGMFGAAAISDERMKEDVRKDPRALDEYLASLDGYRYRYKGALDDGREHLGVMAQDLYLTELGREQTEGTPRGKGTMTIRPELGTYLAALGRLDERLRKVEGKR